MGRNDLHGAKRALELALETGATGETKGKTLLILGEIRRRLGELKSAAETTELFILNLREYPQLGPMWKASGLHNLGLTYRQLHRLEEARDAYRQAAEEYRRENLRETLGQVLWNLAWVLTLLSDTEAAREALLESKQARQDEWARWHQAIGLAFIEAVEGWQPSTTAITRRTLQAESAPTDVRVHAYWLLGREALRRGDLDVAITAAEGATKEAQQDSGDNRAFRDAIDLWRSAKQRQHDAENKAERA